MNLDYYIQGIRKGRDINCLEREAMLDPFLADALEGYDRVKGEHLKRIDAMKRQIIQQNRPKNNLLLYWGIAAAILIAAGTGIYFLRDKLPANYYFTGSPEIKSNANTSVIASKSVFRKIPDPLRPDSLQPNFLQLILQPDSIRERGYFFEKQDTFFLIAPFVTKPLTNSLPVPLLVQDTTETINKEKIEEKPEITVINPKPAVGYKEYENYLRREIRRPADGECEGVKGKVVLAFSINGNGRPYDITVVKSLCSSTDAEAIRLLKEGPGWISGDKNAIVEIRF